MNKFSLVRCNKFSSVPVIIFRKVLNFFPPSLSFDDFIPSRPNLQFEGARSEEMKLASDLSGFYFTIPIF